MNFLVFCLLLSFALFYDTTRGYSGVYARWTKTFVLQANPIKKSEIREQQNWQRSLKSLHNLTDRIVQKLNLTDDSLIPVSLPPHLAQAEGLLARTKPVSFTTDAFRSQRLNYLRRVYFSGNGYHVFNLLALPKNQVNLPILGIDIVILPGEILAAIDFQPVGNLSFPIIQNLIQRDILKFRKWERILPHGGDFPAGAAQFFSANAVWTRFPNDKPWAKLLFIEQCAEEFVSLYAEALSSIQLPYSLQQSEAEMRTTAISNYLQYRIENDPAKRVLVASFGKNWTNAVLSSIVFPISY